MRAAAAWRSAAADMRRQSWCFKKPKWRPGRRCPAQPGAHRCSCASSRAPAPAPPAGRAAAASPAHLARCTCKHRGACGDVYRAGGTRRARLPRWPAHAGGRASPGTQGVQGRAEKRGVGGAACRVGAGERPAVFSAASSRLVRQPLRAVHRRHVHVFAQSILSLHIVQQCESRASDERMRCQGK